MEFEPPVSNCILGESVRKIGPPTIDVLVLHLLIDVQGTRCPVFPIKVFLPESFYLAICAVLDLLKTLFSTISRVCSSSCRDAEEREMGVSDVAETLAGGVTRASVAMSSKTALQISKSDFF